MASDTTFAARLRALREARGWTANALAVRAGVDPTHLGRLERGERDDPGLATMMKLADALGCTLDDLAGRTPPG